MTADALPAHARYDHWRQGYLYGTAQGRPEDHSLDQPTLQALLGALGLPCVVIAGAPMDPLRLINPQGVTVWTLLFHKPFTQDKGALEVVAQGRSTLFLAPELVRQNFASHVNWPAPMVARHPLGLEQGSLFVLPFLLYKDAPEPPALPNSLKRPDGSLEILGHGFFDDTRPEGLLEELGRVREYVMARA